MDADQITTLLDALQNLQDQLSITRNLLAIILGVLFGMAVFRD